MNPSKQEAIKEAYPLCFSFVGAGAADKLCSGRGVNPKAFPEVLARRGEALGLPDFLPELARLEQGLQKIASARIPRPEEVDRWMVNPSLQLLQVSWKNLPGLFQGEERKPHFSPQPGKELVLIWQTPRTRQGRIQIATAEDLLTLKMTVEEILPEEVARTEKTSVGALNAAIDRAAEKGILLRPQSRLRREPENFLHAPEARKDFLVAPRFTLQWHITQACDLHCRHCYDRTNRSSMPLDKSLAVLDDLKAFCRSRYVQGQVSFTGGNPFLHPHFPRIYKAAADLGFSLAVLGNPVSRGEIQELMAIQHPEFFQVSLEGLPEHNDFIRGAGHFQRIMKFLETLRELRIYSMVMLTLTQDNIDQVLPLAEILHGRADSFTFNRLSRAGEGANLQLPSPAKYEAFLKDYARAVGKNPILALKDNLLNIVYQQQGGELFGGCTGYGCGAAFNFLTLLADGEIHACRKFPSLIGNTFEKSLADLYDSAAARRYRSGTHACRLCPIRPVCGGCLAVIQGQGLDVFTRRDPYCFIRPSLS